MNSFSRSEWSSSFDKAREDASSGMRHTALLLTTLLCLPSPLHLHDQPKHAEAAVRGTRCSERRPRRSAAPPPTPAGGGGGGGGGARAAPDSPMLNYIFDSHATAHKHLHDRFNSPMFEDAGGARVSQDIARVEADTGETAFLDCKVSGLQEKLVSWLRVYEDEQLELLTVGLKTHTADSRYRVEVSGVGDNWRLGVAAARPADSGVYCCQVSTHPPMLRRSALLVHAPEMRLPRDAFIESGETLSLRCGVRHVRLPEGAALHWYRGAARLDLDPLAGGVLVSTELRERDIASELQVARLTPAHAGNYTCRLDLPAHAPPPSTLQASATVHVLQGSSLAELQSGGCRIRFSNQLLLLMLLALHSMRGARPQRGR